MQLQEMINVVIRKQLNSYCLLGRYIQSTSVPMAVTLLVDSGLNMRSKLSGGTTKETYGSKATATALAVLDTLKEDEDYVTLITFDGDGSKLLNTTMIYNKALLYRSFSIRLPQNVAGGSKVNTNASATSDAINSAITALSTPGPVPANYLKVVIVLTTGEQFQNLSPMNMTPSNTGVNTFVYNFLATAPQCSASARTSFESIAVSKLDNPLYALQSYYSFLASVHKSFMGDKVDFGQQYADYSGVDNSTLTISKAGTRAYSTCRHITCTSQHTSYTFSEGRNSRFEDKVHYTFFQPCCNAETTRFLTSSIERTSGMLIFTRYVFCVQRLEVRESFWA